MADFNTKQSNLDQLNEIEESDFDTPIAEEAISGMYELVQMCDEYDLPQPEIYPWSGGKGIQAEWDLDHYIEISLDGDEINFYSNESSSGDWNIECSFENIHNAVQLLRLIFDDVDYQ